MALISTLAYCAYSYLMKKSIKCRDMTLGVVFTKLHFHHNFQNCSIKLECYLILGLKGLLGSNAQTYWDHA
jgi:hypothetical protein